MWKVRINFGLRPNFGLSESLRPNFGLSDRWDQTKKSTSLFADLRVSDRILVSAKDNPKSEVTHWRQSLATMQYLNKAYDLQRFKISTSLCMKSWFSAFQFSTCTELSSTFVLLLCCWIVSHATAALCIVFCVYREYICHFCHYCGLYWCEWSEEQYDWHCCITELHAQIISEFSENSPGIWCSWNLSAFLSLIHIWRCRRRG